MEILLKFGKASKYYVQDFHGIFLLLTAIELLNCVSGNILIFAQRTIFGPKKHYQQKLKAFL